MQLGVADLDVASRCCTDARLSLRPDDDRDGEYGDGPAEGGGGRPKRAEGGRSGQRAAAARPRAAEGGRSGQRAAEARPRAAEGGRRLARAAEGVRGRRENLAA